MVTGALVPADSGVCSRIAPVAALNAYRSPLYVVVKTTLLVTAAAPYGDEGSLSSHSIFPVSWLTATISPVALPIEASKVAELSVTPLADIGTARLLTAANAVEPLVASWDSTPPNTPGSRSNLAGSGMVEVGVAFSVSSPSLSCPLCTPTGSFHSSLP